MQNVTKKTKRSLSWLLMLALILSLCAMPAGAALVESPDLEIGTLAELQAFAADVTSGKELYKDKTVVLTADIDASGETWSPIGAAADNKSFRGTFDGQGHTVTLAIKSSERYMAMFRYNHGTIKNVKVAGSITCTTAAAGFNAMLCAWNKNDGVIDACINEAACSLSGASSAALVANNQGIVKNCINRGSVTAAMLNGVIAYGGKLENCLNVGTLANKAYNMSTGTAAGLVQNCYFLDTTSATNMVKTGTAKTEAELKDPAFAATLGEAFAADPNGGFPVLKWELTGSSEKPHEHSFGAWAADDDKTHSRSCDCGEKQTEPHQWADGKCTVCGAKAPTPVVIPVCSVRVTLGFANASFKVPSGTELKITWKFVNDENGVPKGWQMLVNGMEPVMGGYSYAVPENEAGITGTIPSGMVLFTTGKPDDLSFTPADADCADGVTKELKNTPLTKEQLLFELKFVDIATKEEIGTYGDGYPASGTYGAFTISATGNRTIGNYVTMHFNGYRIYMGTYGNVDRQIKTVHVGADGVIEKSVTMYVEVNHSTRSDKHVQPVKFVCGDETVLETTVPLKNAYVNSYTPIELDMTKAAEALKELGYELDLSKTYTVTCNDFTHDPAVTVVEVTKIAQPDPEPDPKPDPEPIVFKDVRESDYFFDAVQWAVKGGITAGTGKDTFSPDEGCTRAQIVTFLYRAAGSPKVENAANPFKDVSPADGVFYDAILWAYTNGITAGTSKDTFSPNATCTRAQIVTFLYKACGNGAEAPAPSFKDVPQDAFYAKAAAWAYANGVTSGTGKDTFSPDQTCTRAQAVTFLYNASLLEK